MTKTYSIADLHGRHDLLVAAIARIEEGNHSAGTVVFTGDYVDRGPASRQIIETLMDGPQTPGWKWICLRGNHEEIMMAGCLGMLHWWLPNGGGATLMSYGAKAGEDAVAATARVPLEHIEWMRDLPVMHNDGKRLFVHAGVEAGVPLDQQDEQKNTWMLYPDGAEDGYAFGGVDLHVVHGHHQHEEGPMLFAGRSNFDTLAWYTGRLVVGVFDDDVPGGPVSTIEIKGPHIEDMRRPA
ncbi:serine/threonine protein phosphatase 1 [Rhizobium leguminosarum]|uniref:metallophosphoesterase n=1 Tax=Rhizobium leguminosarum TaxID=384 RepID=UPI001614A47E|nr:metallophosphoesterase [Rhizobium leguminosarum]MBB5664712.1 serine/threonine protein phosphatase 1 [Rhizobium leguminosarum]